MIHRNAEIVDLDPQTWRNLGAIFPLAEWGESRFRVPGVLTILHDEGVFLRADLLDGTVIDNIPAQIDDPAALAAQLHRDNPGLTRVQVFEKASLRRFSNAVQKLDWANLSSGDFYLRAWELAQADPRGLCYYPSGLPRIGVLKAAQTLIRNTPDGGHLVLGVYDAGKPYFSLIARVDQQQVTLVTTFDALVKYGVDTTVVPSSAADEQQVIPLIEQHFGMVARTLFCDRATLVKLIQTTSELEQ
jgi:hypothetical protein